MKKLNLKFMFTVAAVLLVFTGAMALSAYAVPAIQAGYGITGLSMVFAFLIVGVAQVVFGVVAWAVRKDPASKTLTTLAHGYGSLFALWAVVDVIGNMGAFSSLPGHDNSMWLWVVIFCLLAIGFFATGKGLGSQSRN